MWFVGPRFCVGCNKQFIRFIAAWKILKADRCKDMSRTWACDQLFFSEQFLRSAIFRTIPWRRVLLQGLGASCWRRSGSNCLQSKQVWLSRRNAQKATPIWTPPRIGQSFSCWSQVDGIFMNFRYSHPEDGSIWSSFAFCRRQDWHRRYCTDMYRENRQEESFRGGYAPREATHMKSSKNHLLW